MGSPRTGPSCSMGVNLDRVVEDDVFEELIENVESYTEEYSDAPDAVYARIVQDLEDHREEFQKMWFNVDSCERIESTIDPDEHGLTVNLGQNFMGNLYYVLKFKGVEMFGKRVE